MKTLVIAEKPSVAADIVRALTPKVGSFTKHDDSFENEQYIITSAVGHLLEIQAPEEYEVKRGKWSFAHLPVIPPHFDLKPIEKTRARLSAITKLIRRKDVSALVNACDAGREGELIFRLIEQHSKSKHPVQRLWLQSMTPQAIRDGFEHLRNNAQMLPLADAARCRSEADWLVGINGTRAMTAFNSRDGGFFLTTVGRVQTPTLSIVVEREEQIRNFVSRPYWQVEAEFDTPQGAYKGMWFDPAWKKNPQDAHARADRIWNAAEAKAIVQAVQGQTAQVSEETKPSSQACPLLFDLTSLQREANSRFGFSAKTTLQLAQSLYEKHKALTYPRTDARALPEDYVPVVKDTLSVFAKHQGDWRSLGQHAATALEKAYVKPNKRVFDNSKVSDHFAIIPTAQLPSGLSEAEQKIYDMVSRRFVAVFFPPAQYLLTTRIGRVAAAQPEAKAASHQAVSEQATRNAAATISANNSKTGKGGKASLDSTEAAAHHHFKTEGKVLVDSGWLAVYDKQAISDDKDASPQLPPLPTDARAPVLEVASQEHKTRPPARYTEATLLSAMEGAGKAVEDDELRVAMQEKGLGTPATRSSIIEGLLTEKYILREGRELIPTAKSFQLVTLLRGLEVEELCQPSLTGQWEYKLAQMEKGQLSRAQFMQEIASMTERLVNKAKSFDRDSVPGDYATLSTPCPHCGGVVRENYRRYSCTGTGPEAGEGCGFSIGKSPGGRVFELAEVEQLLKDKKIGPLEGFRSKAGWPFTAQILLVEDEDNRNYKLEFDFGQDKAAGENAAPVDFSQSTSLGQCLQCGGKVYAHGTQYVCEKALPNKDAAGSKPSCGFKSGQIILQQPIAPEQMTRLLTTGKTDLLEHFISARTRRAFKARLAWDAKAKKVGFEFEERKTAPRTKVAAKTTTKAPAKTTAKAKTTKAKAV